MSETGNQEQDATAPNDIGWAVRQMRAGKHVRRPGWNGKRMFLFIVPSRGQDMVIPPATPYPLQDYVAMKTADNTVVPWLASQTDLLAEDWEIADE